MMKLPMPSLLTAAAVLFSYATASAAVGNITGAVDLTRQAYRLHNSHAAFSGERSARTEANNRIVFPQPWRADGADSYKPNHTLGMASNCGDIDGPDGKLWYYTIDLDNKAIVHNQYYTELVLQAYHIKIYDDNHKLVGTIDDKMRYASDEVRVPQCDVLPVVTRHFFNTDDRMEIAVGLAVNSSTPGINHYRTVVYQLGGEKDGEGYDKIVYTLPELVADVLDASVPGGPEEFYMTLAQEFIIGEYPSDQDGTQAVWDYYTGNYIQLDTYGMAVDSKGPSVITSHRVHHLNLPGDQESAQYMIGKMVDGVPYLVYSQYEEPLFTPFYSYLDDMEQRETNNLLIQVDALRDGKAETVQTTRIPVIRPTGEYNAAFFSIGDLRYREDIDNKHYGTDGKFAFTVRRSDYVSLASESGVNNFYIYKPDGTLHAVVFENVLGFNIMTDVPGKDPQVFFVSAGDAGYVYSFFDMYSCKVAASFPYMLEVEDSDPDVMTTNIDRVPFGDSYRYAAELRLPSEEDDIVYLRVAWLDNQGKHIRTDEVNIGSNVMYPQCFINGSVLQPGLIHSDNEMEYLVLIKRGKGDGSVQEECYIAQPRSETNPDGKLLISFLPEERGNLAGVYIYPGADTPFLSVSYIDSGRTSIGTDYYNLPLDKANGITDTFTPGDDLTVAPDGCLIVAGAPVEIFTVQGQKVAQGAPGSTDITDLPAGIYIARSGSSVRKFVKK